MSSARTLTTCGAVINHLTYALTLLDQIQPESLRRPVANVLRTAIEAANYHHDGSAPTIGLPIVNALDIADALSREAQP